MNLWRILRSENNREHNCRYHNPIKKIKLCGIDISNICSDCILSFYAAHIRDIYNLRLFGRNYLKSIKPVYKIVYYNERWLRSYRSQVIRLDDSIASKRRNNLIELLICREAIIDWLIDAIKVNELVFMVYQYYTE